MTPAVAPEPVRRVPRYVPPFVPPCGHHRQIKCHAESDGQNKIALRVCQDCGWTWQVIAYDATGRGNP